jgi:hypothetical protein
MSRYRTKHTDTQVITLNENDDAAFSVEIDFYVTPGSPQTWEQPAEGPEIEIIRVSPYTTRKRYPGEGAIFVGRGEVTFFLDCPKWLERLLIEAVDVDKLQAEEADPDREYDRRRDERMA